MEAACRGAAEAGGASRGVILAGAGGPNAWVRETVVASDLGERLRILRDSTGAWIFLPRGLGTMLEIAWMAESVVKAAARSRPFVFLGAFWRPVVETALAEASNPEGAATLSGAVCFVSSAGEAAAAAFGSGAAS